MQRPDVVIAGAGVVGLSIALALCAQGSSVVLLERGRAARQASWAAAGMLAAQDPANPSALSELAALSLRLYPGFLEDLRKLCGIAVPFETAWTLEGESIAPDACARTALLGLQPRELASAGFHLRAEHSLDPRKLAHALSEAARNAGVDLREHTSAEQVSQHDGGVCVHTGGERVSAGAFVDCTGAWSSDYARPIKGQMLRIQLPAGAMHMAGYGAVVVRTPEVYVVPRLDGSALIGATIEDAGFDTTTDAARLARLRLRAEQVVPGLQDARELDRWAGLRPGSPDGLPSLGEVAPHQFVATGLYRNGILLAPAVASVMARLLTGDRSPADLRAFRPARLAPAPLIAQS